MHQVSQLLRGLNSSCCHYTAVHKSTLYTTQPEFRLASAMTVELRQFEITADRSIQRKLACSIAASVTECRSLTTTAHVHCCTVCALQHMIHSQRALRASVQCEALTALSRCCAAVVLQCGRAQHASAAAFIVCVPPCQ
eukprot:7973-Heterococcus_DN1.PRE.3